MLKILKNKHAQNLTFDISFLVRCSSWCCDVLSNMMADMTDVSVADMFMANVFVDIVFWTSELGNTDSISCVKDHTILTFSTDWSSICASNKIFWFGSTQCKQCSDWFPFAQRVWTTHFVWMDRFWVPNMKCCVD